MNKIFLLLFFLPPLLLFSQSDSINDDQWFQQKLETIAENQSSTDLDLTPLEEQLSYYKEHPLNINSATRIQLQQLMILNDLQITNLLVHIETTGELLSVSELQVIDGFDMQTIYSLLPYIKAETRKTETVKLLDALKMPTQKILLRYERVFEQEAGYEKTSNGYTGSPDKLFARYSFNASDKFRIGFTAEKDPGEQFFKGAQKQGFDFYSLHFILKDIGVLKTLAVGDYQLQFGQGLILWNGLMFNKTSDAIAIKRNADGIHAHTSTDENMFFRGAAGAIQYKKLVTTIFVSRKKIDANAQDTLVNGDISSVSSLQQTGEHATTSEIADKHTIEQTIAGADISYKAKKWDLGITSMFMQLSAPLSPDLKMYNQFAFRGNQLMNGSLHYGTILRNFNFFGETALSDNGGWATVNGVLFAPDKRVSLSLLNRNYQRNYQSYMSNAFSEGTAPANEHGTYIGLQIKPVSTVSINSYMDFFTFPWLRYQISAPSSGYEYFSQLNYTPTKKFMVYIHYRSKEKYNDLNILDRINIPTPVRQMNYRLNASYTANEKLRFNCRMELVNWHQDGLKAEKGFLMAYDVHLKPTKLPLTFTIRYALFQTDSYNSRVYAYENDMPFTYSIPAYYDKGSRVYLLINYSFNRRLTIWLRFAQTFYDNLNVISPGSLNQINGNTKSDVKAELRWTF